MSDKVAFKVELTFLLDCQDKDIDKLQDKLDYFGWFILQEIKLDKAIKSFPGAVETAYNVVVTKLENNSIDEAPNEDQTISNRP